MRAISDRIKSFKGGDFKQQGEVRVLPCLIRSVLPVLVVNASAFCSRKLVCVFSSLQRETCFESSFCATHFSYLRCRGGDGRRDPDMLTPSHVQTHDIISRQDGKRLLSEREESRSVVSFCACLCVVW